MAAFGKEDSVVAASTEAVAHAIGDDEDGAVLGEVGRRLQQIDAGLADRTTAAANCWTSADLPMPGDPGKKT
jgi:hypothetical protein